MSNDFACFILYEVIGLCSRRIEAVGAIVEGLSKRDPHFLFIKESFDEFLHGDFGLCEVRSSRFGLGQGGTVGPSHHLKYCPHLYDIFDDILNTTIYELLDKSDIDITPEQASNLSCLEQKVKLLKALYERSNLVPQLARTVPPNHPTPNSQGEHEYRYPSRLKSSNIRVLCIQPGLEESPIECELEERSLDNDKIEETISYVWGEAIFDKEIKINGSAFRITTNLDSILRHLRHRDVIRTIWIDAICINQSDLEEKAHQIGLMRDIYSKTRKTIIWLGDGPAAQERLELYPIDRPGDTFDLVPEEFGGNLIDQYDLVTILEEFLQYGKGSPWDEKRVKAATMLTRCLNIIMTHKWWERIWTIQEAVLPPNEPIIYFRGYYFSYGTLISALDVSVGLSKDMKSASTNFAGAATGTFPLSGLIYQMVQQHAHGGNNPVIRRLRPEKSSMALFSEIQNKRLQFLVASVAHYRASDPRDKIFALKSLQLGSEGRLIKVDYNQSAEAVFRRITARCLSSQERLFSAFGYNLFLEGQNTLNSTASSPSWAHDFTYSDAGRQVTVTRQWSLQGVLLETKKWQPMWEQFLPDESVVCFATPKTLFCSGISVGVIYCAVVIPDLSTGTYQDYKQFFVRFIRRTRQELQSATADNVAIQDRHAGQSIDSEAEREGKAKLGISNIPFPTGEEIVELATLGTTKREPCSVPEVEKEYIKLMVSGLGRGISGTCLFATKNGIVGLATAPLQEGDTLAIIHKYPNYLILREVKNREGKSQPGEKSRIVARAAITENKDKMRDRVDSFQKSFFQII
ncbi:heterokaryon incompatibility protein-domain-containing protein [Xylaria digitata]|nr:heterokaryon incompatibility protein-domain-containing protein [Xylaria digitata]